MIDYSKLNTILFQRKMKWSELRTIISSKTITRMRNNEAVSLEVIEKICLFLHVRIEDIVEIKEEPSEENFINKE